MIMDPLLIFFFFFFFPWHYNIILILQFDTKMIHRDLKQIIMTHCLHHHAEDDLFLQVAHYINLLHNHSSAFDGLTSEKSRNGRVSNGPWPQAFHFQ